MAGSKQNGTGLETQILPVRIDTSLGAFQDPDTLERWILPTDTSNLKPLHKAAELLKTTSLPVGFPTETVYGLAADATRSAAVKGIYKAKGRPSDNPLIVHISDLTMLRSLLQPPKSANGDVKSIDPIPEIYKVLIKNFWPGPLTILLPNPTPSKLAPEVTAGLPTFGARMPNSPLTLSLIQLAGVPLAGPSANASTKPSPTTAQHVKHDLNGKIEAILDGGPCQVGVESTVVDGLSNPPVILRPGGVSIDRIRECEGWSGVVQGYKDQSEVGSAAPRAPGMKYKHYSPKAKVILYEASAGTKESCGISSEVSNIIEKIDSEKSVRNLIGIVSTKYWRNWAGFDGASWTTGSKTFSTKVLPGDYLPRQESYKVRQGQLCLEEYSDQVVTEVIEISLGEKTADIAHGLFSALRELDLRGVDTIYVEGIEDKGDIAAAVMNRLRKAATIIEK